MTQKIRLLIALVLMSIILIGCGVQPGMPGISAPAPQVQDEQTRQLLREAQSAPPEEAASLRLEAADRLAEQGHDQEAFSILDSIDKRRLPPELGLSVALQQAVLAMNLDNPDTALRSLDFHALPPNLNQDEVIRLNMARAEAYDQLNNPINAARELISASQMTDDVDLQQSLHDQIWSLLKPTEAGVLDQAAQNRNNNFFEQGWFERAAMLANIKDMNEQQEKLFDWQLLWDQHPAALMPPRAVDTELATDLSPIPLTDQAQRVALFLPLQGDLANISRIITEGFVAAMQSAPMSHRVDVIMLDSTEIRMPEQLFHSARTQGADFIVGPLDRNFVNQLAQFPDHPLPVLALNPAEEGLNPPLQLDLSTDHEVSTLMRRASELGYRNAMIIRSDNRSGERVEQSIKEAFQEQGGHIIASLTFRPTESNSEQIRQLLVQDAEIARTIPSRSRSGMSANISHETDVIFMVTEPRDARLIRPMLLYHFAGNIPVMATSQLFEGNPSAARDNDLSGITFIDVPWRLAEPSETRLAVQERRDNADANIGKLYALGADAFIISQNLPQLLQQHEIMGETGVLSLGHNRRISRELTWAQFNNGVPKLITE